MTIIDQIKDEKLQYDINREAAEISALSSGKIHKGEYFTGEDILPSSNQQIIEQARFTYSPLVKAFDLADQINKFIEETRPKNYDKKQEKKTVIENLRDFLNAREMVLNGFKSKIFETKSTGTGLKDHFKLKVLTPKQMLQRLPTALAQVKAGNNSENLLNEVRQIIYSLYQAREITKKVYNNSMKSF